MGEQDLRGIIQDLHKKGSGKWPLSLTTLFVAIEKGNVPSSELANLAMALSGLATFATDAVKKHEALVIEEKPDLRLPIAGETVAPTLRAMMAPFIKKIKAAESNGETKLSGANRSTMVDKVNQWLFEQNAMYRYTGFDEHNIVVLAVLLEAGDKFYITKDDLGQQIQKADQIVRGVPRNIPTLRYYNSPENVVDDGMAVLYGEGLLVPSQGERNAVQFASSFDLHRNFLFKVPANMEGITTASRDRLLYRLRNAGLFTIGALSSLSRHDLNQFNGIGPKTPDLVEQVLGHQLPDRSETALFERLSSLHLTGNS